MKLTLGFSPCPNDTFIFDALVNTKIETGDLKFEAILEDVENLNKLALKNTLDVSKISYGVFPLLANNYILLNSGSALGTGVGPLLIANEEVDNEAIKNYTIAIPGEHTSAHMLFSLAYPNAKNKIFIRYDEIENFVLSSKGKNIAGVIIHENRFTYQQKGLKKIIDLGEFWENKTHSPIPLGGIVAKRKLDFNLLKRIEQLIKQSIEYSFRDYPLITEYVRKHSQEMEEDIMRKHINLYVNNFSLDLGKKGKSAIVQFLQNYPTINSSSKTSTENIFLH